MQSDELVIPLPVNRDVEIQSLKDEVCYWKQRHYTSHRAVEDAWNLRVWSEEVNAAFTYLFTLLGFVVGYGYCISLSFNKTLNNYGLIVILCLALWACLRTIYFVWKGPSRKSYASMVKSVDTEDLKSSA